MKHNYKSIDGHQDSRIKIGRRNAYHQAGRAAAIHLGNLQKQLPPVHFQVTIKPQGSNKQKMDRFAGIYSKYTVIIEGGRLIQNLPLSIAEATQHFTWFQQAEYRCAFEADVINLLAGSLAEAKYIASRDNEVFNANLINLGALRNYGGISEIELTNEYMECYMPNNSERTEKLNELFLAAFNLVDDSLIWRKITALAEFILGKPLGTIPCDDVISLLDSDVNFRKVESIAQQKTPNKIGHFIQTNTLPV